MGVRSLELRAYTLLKLADLHLPTITKYQRKQWKQLMHDTHIPLGRGKGVRWEESGQHLGREILGCMLSLACERLLCEPKLQAEYSALRFALQLLNLR